MVSVDDLQGLIASLDADFPTNAVASLRCRSPRKRPCCRASLTCND